MVSYNYDFSIVLMNKKALLSGLFITLELTIFSIIFGLILGMILCLLKSSKNSEISITANIFIQLFRGLPLLVLLIWLFYALPPIIGIKISPIATAILALSLNLGAYSAEIFKAGFNSIHKGQIEAAKVLGLSKLHTIKHIIMPQAAKVIIPPLTGRLIETIKLTSLASVIAVNELLHQGQNIIAISFRPLEVYTIIALMYLAIIIPLSFALRKIEKNVRS